MKHDTKDDIPQHIAIIMDGNRRWARSRGLAEIKGHEEGVEALERVVEEAKRLGIKTITVYALSTENLKERAKREMFGLFNLMRTAYYQKITKMMQNGVKVGVLGEIRGLPDAIKRLIMAIKDTYIKNEAITLNIALNYGGKKELVDAIKEIMKQGIDLERINEEMVNKHLYTKGQGDPELVIRTGGRVRLSNFLLWQTAYSELYFTKTLWPDFGEADLRRAVKWYQAQKRNFGK